MALRNLRPANFELGDRVHTDTHGVLTLTELHSVSNNLFSVYSTAETGTEMIFTPAKKFIVERDALSLKDIMHIARDTYLGIAPEDREALLNLTMAKVNELQLDDPVNDADAVIDLMQNIASDQRFSTVAS
ncbi:hypothetical protein [Glutamicibacter sp. FBE19]|uniref:hypothetical protein n=1 Tax=Glutamicibacter sp. FBE19 TaxID=2761534 RepID=UPI00189697B0|nr:hypothetical protein [Glutamicibacter sp. FBE19]MBF6671155.1 hypothetical protein [Glutamicibacter sp. FBE19]